MRGSSSSSENSLYNTVFKLEGRPAQAEIGKAFRQLSLKCHPDRNLGVNTQEVMILAEKFKILSSSWAIFQDDIKRAFYNQLLNCKFPFGILPSLDEITSQEEFELFNSHISRFETLYFTQSQNIASAQATATQYSASQSEGRSKSEEFLQAFKRLVDERGIDYIIRILTPQQGLRLIEFLNSAHFIYEYREISEKNLLIFFIRYFISNIQTLKGTLELIKSTLLQSENGKSLLLEMWRDCFKIFSSGDIQIESPEIRELINDLYKEIERSFSSPETTSTFSNSTSSPYQNNSNNAAPSRVTHQENPQEIFQNNIGQSPTTEPNVYSTESSSDHFEDSNQPEDLFVKDLWEFIYSTTVETLRNDVEFTRENVKEKNILSYIIYSLENNTGKLITTLTAINSYWSELTFKYFLNEHRNTAGELPMHAAVRINNARVVKCLLNWGAEIGAGTELGNTSPLHLGINLNRLEIVKTIVQKCSIANNLKTPDGLAPLHLAADMEKDRGLEMVKLLLSWNAPVNGLDIQEHVPLHYAVRRDNLEVVKVLLGNKAKIKKAVDLPNLSSSTGDPWYGLSPIDIAVSRENMQILELLLEPLKKLRLEIRNRFLDAAEGYLKPSSPNANKIRQMFQNTSPTYVSGRTNRNNTDSSSSIPRRRNRNNTNSRTTNCAKVLAPRPASHAGSSSSNSSANSQQPFYSSGPASSYTATRPSIYPSQFFSTPPSGSSRPMPPSSSPVVSAIPSTTASPRTLFDEELARLSTAIDQQQTSEIQLIIGHWVTMIKCGGFKDYDSGSNLLSYLIIYFKTESKKLQQILKLLYEHMNTPEKTGLFSRRLNTGSDRNGLLPIHLVIDMDNKEILNYLLEYGADVKVSVTINKVRTTALQYAVEKNRVELIKLMLEKHPNSICTLGHYRQTLLQTAIISENYNFEMVEIIHSGFKGVEIDYFYYLNHYDYNGWTALHHAVLHHRLDAVQLLLSNGAAHKERGKFREKKRAPEESWKKQITPYNLAVKLGYEDIAECLKSVITDSESPHRRPIESSADGNVINLEDSRGLGGGSINSALGKKRGREWEESHHESSGPNRADTDNHSAEPKESEEPTSKKQAGGNTWWFSTFDPYGRITQETGSTSTSSDTVFSPFSGS